MKYRELRKVSLSSLRKFGLVIAVALALIGIFLIWKERPAASYFSMAAALFAFFGLVSPRILKPLYIAWMMLAHYLSFVVTYIILTIFFIIVITPIAGISRLLGKDYLSRKFPGGKETYWVDAHSYLDERERYTKPF